LLEDFRQHHEAVRVEGGIGELVDVVAYERTANLFEMARDREINRAWLVRQLEDCCRRLVPGNAAAGARLERAIFLRAPRTHVQPANGQDGAIPAKRQVEPHHSSLGQGRGL